MVRVRSLLTLSLSILPNHPPLLAGRQGRVDICKSLLVYQHWCVHVLEFIRERRLWIRLYFPSSAQHVLFGWFERLDVSSRTNTFLWATASSCSILMLNVRLIYQEIRFVQDVQNFFLGYRQPLLLWKWVASTGAVFFFFFFFFTFLHSLLVINNGCCLDSGVVCFSL